jgi:uncharacterized Ntn-hydrolase superfamily protein
VTFSLVGRCARTGMVGVAVSSSSPAVAARCAHARAGVGAAASQNVTDPRLGPLMLELIESGRSAQEAVTAIAKRAPHAEHRQLTAIDGIGGSGAFSGSRTLGVHGTALGVGAAAAGNLLADAAVPGAMLRAFAARADDDLGDRLMAALAAGLAAGGEVGPVHSAGLLVCDQETWPMTDLRVDWDDAPIDRLAQLWELWKPQAGAYVTRALDPEAAPSYGVAGDERDG